MNANEKRAEEVVAACSRASYEGIDPRSVILIALASAERRGEDRVLRRFMRYGYDIEVDEYRRERKARRARGVRRS